MVTTPHCQPRVVLERAGEGEMKLSMRGPNVLNTFKPIKHSEMRG